MANYGIPPRVQPVRPAYPSDVNNPDSPNPSSRLSVPRMDVMTGKPDGSAGPGVGLEQPDYATMARRSMAGANTGAHATNTPQAPAQARMATSPTPATQPDNLGMLRQQRVEETKGLLDDFNTRVNDQDGRMRSGIAGFFDQWNQNLRARLASGAPMGWGDFYQLVGAGVGGFAGGAFINPAWNEERDRGYRIADRQGRIKQIDEAIKVETAGRQADSQARLNDARTHDLANKPAQDEKHNAFENLKLYPDDAAAQQRAARSGWVVGQRKTGTKNVQTVFDPETGVQYERDPEDGKWLPSQTKEGTALTTKATPKVGTLPKSFYALDGVDEDTIHYEALKKAGARDFSAGFELDPAKVNLMKKDDETYDDAVGRIRLMLNQGYDEMGNPIHFSEFAKAADQTAARKYDAAVASAEIEPRKQLTLYRQAIDSTSQDSKTPLVSLATFQQGYKEFWSDYQKTFKKDPQLAEQKRAQFFGKIAQYRLR